MDTAMTLHERHNFHLAVTSWRGSWRQTDQRSREKCERIFLCVPMKTTCAAWEGPKSYESLLQQRTDSDGDREKDGLEQIIGQQKTAGEQGQGGK
eukprot:6212165-Pleurochrysis_carterae.AAC.1